MKKIIMIMCTIAFLAGGMATPAGAGPLVPGPVSAAFGYPVWYQDATALRLELCLDQNGMCLAVLPNPAAPPSVVPAPGVSNWDAAGEAFYYMATAQISDGNVDAILILALEAAFANGPVIAGDQVVFTRLRVGINPRVPAAANSVFTITHPFGTAQLTTRGVNQNESIVMDLGIGAPGAFPNLNNAGAAIVDAAAGSSIGPEAVGPFLIPTAAFPRVVVGGNTYLSTPGALVQVNPGPNGAAFTITGPLGVATTTDFDIQAKVSGCAVTNTAPVAAPGLTAAAASGQAQVIPVLGNVTPGTTVGPPPGTTPLNPGSVAITVLPTNGTAVPNTNGTVTYTPNAAFAGADSFTYTVQDNCALVSNAVAAAVTVENLTVDRAEFRPRTGKWTITGQSSAAAGSLMTLHKGDAAGPVIGTTTVQADGTFRFVGKSKTPPGAVTVQQSVTAQSAATVTRAGVLKMQ